MMGTELTRHQAQSIHTGVETYAERLEHSKTASDVGASSFAWNLTQKFLQKLHRKRLRIQHLP